LSQFFGDRFGFRGRIGFQFLDGLVEIRLDGVNKLSQIDRFHAAETAHFGDAFFLRKALVRQGAPAHRADGFGLTIQKSVDPLDGVQQVGGAIFLAGPVQAWASYRLAGVVSWAGCTSGG